MQNTKVIYILIGAKGSGKSYIGSLMEQSFGIKFVRVEDWVRKMKPATVDDEDYVKNVFALIENVVRDHAAMHERIVFESTGITVHFDQMLANLRNDFYMVTIGVTADTELCLTRVKTRDQSIHINVSDDQVQKVNKMVIEKNMKTDHVLDNTGKTEEELAICLADIVLYKDTAR